MRSGPPAGWPKAEQKRHPCLVPYEELPESERDYDRNTAMNTLKLILSLGFKIQR